ncbi:MAG: hypothetical protein ACRDP8_23180, partial [Actinopolymorphaceae bacterium]
MGTTTLRSASVAGLALITVAALVAACSPAGSGGGGRTGSSDGGNASGKDSSPFIVARTADIDLVDPARATAFPTVQTLDLVYDTLLETDDDGELRPGLATRWTVDDDGRTITLT